MSDNHLGRRIAADKVVDVLQALALTENFHISPENLIVQGYGEAFPRVQTQAAEERNRRVTARRITPLLRQIAED